MLEMRRELGELMRGSREALREISKREKERSLLALIGAIAPAELHARRFDWISDEFNAGAFEGGFDAVESTAAGGRNPCGSLEALDRA